MKKIVDSDYIYILKAAAIFSVICAHVANTGNQKLIVQEMALILENIGSLGVGVFYFFAGYFFDTRKNLKKFFKDKMKKILIPWIFTGTIVYLYVNLRKGGINVKEWLFWIVGYKTYLYFLTNLMFFYGYYYVFKTKKNLSIVTVFIGIISLNLSAFGFLEYINPYLNPFNFIIYFSLGKIVAMHAGLKKLKEFSFEHRYIFLVMYIFISILSQLLSISMGYFGKITLLSQALSLMIFMGFGQSVCFNKDYIIDVGKKSFSIYLVHMPFAGIITYVFNKYTILGYLLFFKPFIVLYLTYNFINLAIYLTKAIKIGTKINGLIEISKKARERR